MSRKVLLLTGFSLLAFAQPSMAQDASAGEEVTVTTPDEIVVTAQKRSETAQSVPVALTVVTAEALQSSGGTQFTDLAKISPGLTMTQGDQPGNNQIYLRGVGTFAFSIGVEPSVLTVIDDVAVGLQAQSFGDLADLQRVEVLRGPQSTLFGKAASAGVINVTTQAPSRDFTGRAEVLATTDNEQRYVLGLSGPLGSEKLLFRVTGTLGRYEGNVRNLTSGKKINGRDFENVRAKLKFEPSDEFDATLSGYFTKARQNCCAPVVNRLPAGLNLFGNAGVPATAIFAGITPGIENNATRLDLEPVADVKDYGGSLKFNVKLGSHTLTSITAATHYHLADLTDFDGSDLNVRAAFGTGTGGFTQGGSFDAKTFSQEIRLTSPGGNAFEYLIGAYFASNKFSRVFARTAPPVQVRSWQGDTKSDVTAFFAQGSYKLTEALKLLGGVRFNSERIGYKYQNFINGAVYPRDTTAPGHANDSVFTGKAGIQFEPNDDINLFATWARGYKGQAYDLTSSFNAVIALTQPIKPESVDSYEVGLKARFLDRKLGLNLTAFLADFSNYQQQSVDPVQPLTFVLTNVGSVRTKGVEAEAWARPADWFKLSASLAYVDARIVSFPVAQCYPGQTVALGCIAATSTVPTHQDLAGKRLNNAPEWKGNITADLTMPLGSMEAGLNLSYSFQSAVNYTLSQDPATVQGAYGIFNAALSLGDVDDRFKVTVFVRNLFDKQYYSSIANNRNNFGGVANVIFGTLPRDFRRHAGIRASYNF